MLEVEGLVVTAGGVRLVDGVSFEVGAGELFGLVGESGSGKTTAVLALAGLLPAGVERAAGTVVLADEELTAERLERVRGSRIGFVFQDSSGSLDPLMRVGAQVAEVWRIHGGGRREARRRAAELLERVGVGAHRARAYPHELSGGQRQRVGIAMAVALDPRLLIADEPTTALDVTVQAQVMELLSRARKESGAAAVLVSHDLDLLARYADRIGVMYSGRLVEVGAAREVVERPRHPYTRALLASRPRVGAGRGQLPVIEGIAPQPAERPAGCAFHPRCAVAVERCAVDSPALEGGVACWVAGDE
ncbi:ABC transporter ATP-binding protein [Actinocorallia aurantiaca]|uniref:ABC transporter ATP-binding protein n=1 Tax=Actinocorallia aurantiaca TaxID=46204 RepID=A0ABN3UNW5_9ACTN